MILKTATMLQARVHNTPHYSIQSSRAIIIFCMYLLNFGYEYFIRWSYLSIRKQEAQTCVCVYSCVCYSSDISSHCLQSAERHQQCTVDILAHVCRWHIHKS